MSLILGHRTSHSLHERLGKMTREIDGLESSKFVRKVKFLAGNLSGKSKESSVEQRERNILQCLMNVVVE